jgi:hypothetical protein
LSVSSPSAVPTPAAEALLQLHQLELQQVQKKHSEEIVEQKNKYEDDMRALFHRYNHENAVLKMQLTLLRQDRKRWEDREEKYQNQLQELQRNSNKT